MGRGDRKYISIRSCNRAHGHDFSCSALTIGQVLLADLFTDCDNKRFQPIIVPSPNATATATFTQVGMNFVALSI